MFSLLFLEMNYRVMSSSKTSHCSVALPQYRDTSECESWVKLSLHKSLIGSKYKPDLSVPISMSGMSDVAIKWVKFCTPSCIEGHVQIDSQWDKSVTNIAKM